MLDKYLPEYDKYLQFDDKVVSISGVWDLPMVDGEKCDIEFEVHSSMGLSMDWGHFVDGTFLVRGDEWVSLQDQFKDGSHYPAHGLYIFEHKKVITSENIAKFLDSLQSNNKIGRPTKLSADQIAEIKKVHRAQPNLQAQKIADQYGVSDSAIRKVWN